MSRNTTTRRADFEALIQLADQVSKDLGAEISSILKDGAQRPLTPAEAARLIKRAIVAIRGGAEKRKDKDTLRLLEGSDDDIVARVMKTNGASSNGQSNALSATVTLRGAHGGDPVPIKPRPCFHGLEVAMVGGYVKVKDIHLWEGNERLEIHLGQFRQVHGRTPTPAELLDIMLSKMQLPGIPSDQRDDQFEIVALARSIATNGVRKPPIIDINGALLDGNRRVAACYYILHSDEFTPEHRKRADEIYVWQLTDQANDDERRAVVVSLNFENDCKKDWPTYVKARKLHDEWKALLELEPRPPARARQVELKKMLSQKFALGPDMAVVNRYLKMVEWADDFEEYHINAQKRDEFEVKHQASRYFEYFDELSKGHKPGGVAHALGQDEAFKHLVFNLLYEGKFQNWREIRDLKHIAENEEARGYLAKARDEPDVETAQEHIEDAIATARLKNAKIRELAANTRIEAFVTWLEELPVRAFRDGIEPKTLKSLHQALKLVTKHAKAVLGEEAVT